MDVSDILEMKSDKVVTISPDNTIPEVVSALMANKIGALVVLDNDGKLAGIVSERDISRAVNHDAKNLNHRRVGDLVTNRVITCAPDYSVFDVMILMDDNHIRHLPVIDDGKLVGILSMRDVMQHWIKTQGEEIDRLQKLHTA